MARTEPSGIVSAIGALLWDAPSSPYRTLDAVVTPLVVLIIQWLGWRRHKRSAWPLSAVFIIFVISNLSRELYVPALAPGIVGLRLMLAFATVLSVPITWASPMKGAESHEFG